nr:maleylpyruvate isomerase N-terminal domain-containing protein [Prauserella alba]
MAAVAETMMVTSAGPVVDHRRLAGAFGDEVTLLIEAARGVAPETPVPTCPGWTVGDTVRHVGSIYRVAQAWLIDGRRPREWQREPAPGQSEESYVRQGYADLREILDFHTPDEPAATWWPQDRTYGFWRRRMTHDTTVHRVDVEGVGGMTWSGVAADVALDGVDEALMLWFGHRLPRLGLRGTRAGEVGVCTGGYGWLVSAGPDETAVRRCGEPEARSSAAVVSGDPEAVYLWLWGRNRPGAVDVAGDDDAAGQLLALMRLATR